MRGDDAPVLPLPEPGRSGMAALPHARDDEGMMTAAGRLRILLIAEQANPEWVSVPLIGWSMARALAEVAEVHLVTHSRNRESILRAGLIEGDEFTAIDSEAVARPLWRLAEALRGGEGRGFTILQAAGAISYPWFEHLVWRQLGDRIKAGEWDVVHRVTPLSPTATGSLARRCKAVGVPFVIGPLNGGAPWPRQFADLRHAEGEWLSPLRRLYRLIPGRRRMLRATSVVIAGSRFTQAELPRAVRSRSIRLPENAIDPAQFPYRAQATDGKLRACFIGRIVPCKGTEMLLEAAAPLIAAGRMTLDIVGDGPVLQALRTRAVALGLGEGLTFHGWIAHAEVERIVGRCNVLTFPSIHEFGGGAILEAMAMGLAPVVVDYAGPGELVAEGTGWKIPLTDRDGIIADLRALLERLADSPEEIARRGTAARAHVLRHFTWARMAENVLQIHHWALGQAPRPVFFPEPEGPP